MSTEKIVHFETIENTLIFESENKLETLNLKNDFSSTSIAKSENDSGSVPILSQSPETPVTLKISTLPTRSAFLSFFCKTKRPPLLSISENKISTDIKIEDFGDHSKDTEELVNFKTEHIKNCNHENVIFEPDIDNLKNEVIFKSETISEVFDKDSLLVLSDDSELDEPYSNVTKKRPSSIINNEIISISSDESSSSSDCKLITFNKTHKDLNPRRSERLNCKTNNRNKIRGLEAKIELKPAAPLSDYSNLKSKNIDFTLPSNFFSRNTVPVVHDQNSNFNHSVVSPAIVNEPDCILQDLGIVDSSLQSFTQSITKPLTMQTVRKASDIPCTQITAPIAQLTQNPLAHTTTTTQINLKSPTKTQHIAYSSTAPLAEKVKFNDFSRYFNSDSYCNLDPSLREELLSRFSNSQRSSSMPTVTSSTNCNNNNQDSSIVTATNEIVEDRYVIFNVVQRLNIGTFDSSKVVGGKLLPSSSFLIYWKSSDSFGSMKRKLAANLRLSPLELVLTKAHDDLESELYDSTRPSTLNLKGLTLQDFTDQQNALMASKTVNPPVACNSKATVTTAFKFDQRKLPQSTDDSNRPFKSVSTKPALSESVYNLFMYTKTSYARFKLLQLNKKREIFDSVSFLQTAEEEISKFSFTPTQDAPKEQTLILSGTKSVPLIRLNFKTAASKNSQIFSIQCPSDSTISQVLQVLQSTHQILVEGLRVFFDGEILKTQSSILGVLEDEDMVEIK